MQDLQSRQQLLSVFTDDEKAAEVLLTAGERLEQFERAHAEQTDRQSAFTAVFFVRDGTQLIPFGVQVQRISEDAVIGRLQTNELKERAGESFHCPKSCVADVFYTEAYSMRGGALYKHFFRRLPTSYQVDLQTELGIAVDNRTCERDKELCFDIYSHRDAKALKVFTSDPDVLKKQVTMPAPTFSLAGVAPETFSITEYTGAFGSETLCHYLIERASNEQVLCDIITQAAFYGNLDAIMSCVRSEANVNVTIGNLTPLHLAVRGDHFAAVRLLLSNGADPNAKDNRGSTPLYYAESIEVVDLLLKNGANPVHVDDIGMTPYKYHRESGQWSIAAAIGGPEVSQYEDDRAAFHPLPDAEDPFEEDLAPEFGRVFPFRTL